MRPIYLLPLAAMCLLAGWLGYQAGRVPTETEIIDRYAADYVQHRGEGARLTDCAAQPGVGEVRIVVRCTHPAGDVTLYEVALRGGLLARRLEEDE